MKAGFKVETRMCGFGDTVLVVTNYHFTNLVVNKSGCRNVEN
jgi:hypothetical protein